MKNQEIIDELKSFERGYNRLTDDEINKQIEAIFECDYEWSSNVGFINKKTNLKLNIQGLHVYTPNMIRESYERTWSKQTKKGVRDEEKAARNFGNFLRGLLILFISLIIGFIFLKPKSGVSSFEWTVKSKLYKS